MRLFRGLVIAVPLSLLLWTALLSGCKETLSSLVVLNSDGGPVAEAALLSSRIRERGADTRVEGECASSCILLFAAGQNKSLSYGSRVGVHRSDGGALVDSAMADLLLAFDTPPRIIKSMLATPNSRIYWLSPEDLASWKVTLDGSSLK